MKELIVDPSEIENQIFDPILRREYKQNYRVKDSYSYGGGGGGFDREARYIQELVI